MITSSVYDTRETPGETVHEFRSLGRKTSITRFAFLLTGNG